MGMTEHLATRAADLPAEPATAERSKELSLAALDGLKSLVYAVNLRGRLLLANACGQRQLEVGAPFSDRSGLLSSGDSWVAQRLVAALDEAGNGAESAFQCAVGCESWLVRVLPSPDLGCAFIYATCSERAPVPSSILRQMLEFSGAEAEVAYMIADGRNTTEIADARGVSINTVRTQIKEVFRKAGVRRQADLARLLFSMPRLQDPEDHQSGRSRR